MAVNSKDFGAMIWLMASAGSSWLMEMSSKANGLMIRPMELVTITTLKAPPIKVNGMKISKKVKEEKPGQMVLSLMVII